MYDGEVLEVVVPRSGGDVHGNHAATDTYRFPFQRVFGPQVLPLLYRGPI